MLTSNGLANTIVNGIKSKITVRNSDEFMPLLGHLISSYLTKNTLVTYSWVGIQPGSPPTPDPVASYSTSQIVGDFTCSPTRVKDPVMHGIKLGKQITDGVKMFQIMPAAGFVVPPGGFLCAPDIVLPPCPITDIYQHWLFLSNIILAFYKAWIKPTPLAGTHGAFIGSPGAVMIQVS
jgi:hypothetical protein